MSGTNPTLDPPATSNALPLENSRALLKYAWTGALEPTTRDAYNTQVGLQNVSSEITSLIDNLIATYGAISSHCGPFVHQTYPTILSLASTVYNLAQDAGGTEENSYYANILAAGTALYEELTKPVDKQDATTIADFQSTITGVVGAQVDAINALKQQGQDAVQLLASFEEQCKADQKALDLVSSQITSKLAGETGRIAQLSKDVAEKVQEIKNDQAEYERDVINAATTVAYIWIFPVGTIAAAFTMVGDADQAVKMEAKLSALQKLLDDEPAELATDTKITNDLNLMKGDLQKLIDGIGPAMKALGKMQGVWGAIADDLLAVGNMVQNQSAQGNEIVRRFSPKRIVTKWNALAQQADYFMKAASVLPPEIKTLAHAVQEYQAVIRK